MNKRVSELLENLDFHTLVNKYKPADVSDKLFEDFLFSINFSTSLNFKLYDLGAFIILFGKEESFMKVLHQRDSFKKLMTQTFLFFPYIFFSQPLFIFILKNYPEKLTDLLNFQKKYGDINHQLDLIQNIDTLYSSLSFQSKQLGADYFLSFFQNFNPSFITLNPFFKRMDYALSFIQLYTTFDARTEAERDQWIAVASSLDNEFFKLLFECVSGIYFDTDKQPLGSANSKESIIKLISHPRFVSIAVKNNVKNMLKFVDAEECKKQFPEYFVIED